MAATGVKGMNSSTHKIEVHSLDVLGNAEIVETDIKGVYTEVATGKVFIAGHDICLVVSQ